VHVLREGVHEKQVFRTCFLSDLNSGLSFFFFQSAAHLHLCSKATAGLLFVALYAVSQNQQK
jgi:hypothetical protein